MHATTSPRIIAAPWEREQLEASRSTYVGLEDNVRPDEGPLADYTGAFPTRRVEWNRRRQLFQIRDSEDAGFRRLLFVLDAPPDPSTPDVPRTEQELVQLMQDRSSELRQCFIPFDYVYVRKALRETYLQETLGSEGWVNWVADKNKALERSRIRHRASESAAAWNEIRRYWRVLAGESHEPVPMVRGGLERTTT